MKISFITPVYKTEKFLPKLINSIKKLSLEYELIIVNDDPDSDLSKWAQKNIVIVNNKQNLGSLESRKNGLLKIDKLSTHFAFIDPDDYLFSDEWVSGVKDEKAVNFAYMEWYQNKMIKQQANGDIGPNNLDNHIWGIVFPVKYKLDLVTLFEIPKIVDDFPIKEIFARRFGIEKNENPMVVYMMRRSSLSKSEFSRDFAILQIESWLMLYKKYGDVYFTKRFSEELAIYKRIIGKEAYNRYKKLAPIDKGSIFNGTMYRVVRFKAIKSAFLSLFLGRRPHK